MTSLPIAPVGRTEVPEMHSFNSSQGIPSSVDKSAVRPTLRVVLAPVFAVIGAQLFFVFLMATLGDSSDPILSLVLMSLFALASLFILNFFYLRRSLGGKAVAIVVFAFLLRLGIGVIHLFWLIMPDYLSNPEHFTYIWDYQWFHESLQYVSHHWQLNGFLEPSSETYWAENKNAILLAYCAFAYLYTGDFALNIAVWNSLHSVYTAVLIAGLCSHLGANKRQATLALLIVAFQPFGIISSMMMRDFVGQTWLVLGVYLVISTARWPALWLGMIPIAGLLAHSLRPPYLLVILLGAGIVFVTNKVNITGRLIFLIMVGFVLLASGFGGLIGVAAFKTTTVDLMGLSRYLLLPLRLVRAVFGPFPWFQIFDKPPGYEFMPADFLQCVLNLAILVIVIPRIWNRWKFERRINNAVPFAAMLYLLGAFAVGVHVSYVAVGMVLFLPEACLASKTVWLKSIGFACAFFFLGNVAYWLMGLRGSGIMQDVTGY